MQDDAPTVVVDAHKLRAEEQRLAHRERRVELEAATAVEHAVERIGQAFEGAGQEREAPLREEVPGELSAIGAGVGCAPPQIVPHERLRAGLQRRFEDRARHSRRSARFRLPEPLPEDPGGQTPDSTDNRTLMDDVLRVHARPHIDCRGQNARCPRGVRGLLARVACVIESLLRGVFLIIIVRNLSGPKVGEWLAALAARFPLLNASRIDGTALSSSGVVLGATDVLRALSELVDTYERIGLRDHIVSLPIGLSTPDAEVAFWLRRRVDDRVVCFEAPCSPVKDDTFHDPTHDPTHDLTHDLIDPAEEIAAFVRAVGRQEREVDVEAFTPPFLLLETPRLLLARPSRSQCAAYFDAIVGTAMFDTLLWDGPSKPDDLSDFFRLRSPRKLMNLPRSGTDLAIIERSSGSMIGGCGFWFPNKSGTAELGYTLAPVFQGRGYGTEAVGALLAYVRSLSHVVRICAEVAHGNVASERVLEKLGFIFEGTLVGAAQKRGRTVDVSLFRLLAQEPGLVRDAAVRP